jgi:glycosyltransferase involved in cell wall biosynthesis
VTGGAETHCRWLAGRLRRRHEVEVLTTCALDYRTWANHYPPGRTELDGIPVTRFPVERPRDARLFALYSDIVFRDFHTPEDEHTWLEHNGPFAPALVAALPGVRPVDLFVFYSYRYYTTFHGLPRVAERAVLVPTAEDDPAVRLPLFQELLRAPRGLLYLPPEEQELVEAASGNAGRPSAVIGSGVDLAPGFEHVDARSRFELPASYLLYVGRVDWAKGVDRLVDYYLELLAEWPELPPLVLAGKPLIELPDHPRLRVLGEVGEQEKAALIAGCAVLLLPSALESLSLSVLEAWALGRPVLVNAECRVLEGQCRRSNGGLYYQGYAEFAPALRLLLQREGLRAALGRNGQAYVRREYDWDVVERRTEELLERVVGGRRS